MHRRSGSQAGFTLIELMVVVAVIAVLAAVAIPNLVSSRRAANESAAIATLRQIHTSQTDCANRKFIDMDADGLGEYGYFSEMAGAIPPRNAVGTALLPPLLASSFQSVLNGSVSRSGYMFMIYLPDVTGAGLAETAANYAGVDADASETAWCCYAWPATAEESGRRAFFVNQMGELLFTDNTVQSYSGAAIPPGPDAAFAPAAAGIITGRYVAGVVAADGGLWTNVSP